MNKAKIMMALTSLLSLLVASGAFFKLRGDGRSLFSAGRRLIGCLPYL